MNYRQAVLWSLAQQEQLANLAQQQQATTLAGGNLNPFLSPLIQQAGEEAYTTVASQFSGAGRTPSSPVAQQTVADIVAGRALPYAFQTYGQERGFQESLSRAVPSLTAVGGALEDIQAERQLAPQAALSQYYNTVAPIAFGLPVGQTSMTAPRANPITSAAGGAMSGAALAPMLGMGGGMGAAIGAGFGLLGGLL